MANSVQPRRRQPIRLPHPWDCPGKNTGVGYHFFLHCMKVKSEREIVQSYPTLSDPMDCSLGGSFVHRIFQARVLEWGAIAFSKKKYEVLLNNVFPYYSNGNSDRLYFLGLQTHWKVVSAMKLKDAYSLEEKLCRIQTAC